MACPKRIHGPIRRNSHRREQQIQGFTNKEIQILKALAITLQEAVDFDRYACPERAYGSFWSDLYFGLRKKLGEIHYPLPKTVFRPKWIRGLHVEPTARRIYTNSREDITADITALVRRLLEDARASEHDNRSRLTARCVEDLYNGGE